MKQIRDILKIGLPIMLGQACIIILAFADNIMIGWYGVNELAAASFVNGIMNLFIFTELGFTCGMTPIIGAQHGRGDVQGIGRTLRNGIYVNTALGVISLIVLAVIYLCLGRFGQEEALLPLIRPYFIAVGISTLFALGFNTMKQFTDGICMTVVAMAILMGGNLFNILGNWLLIYGKCGFPEMGLLGAGISTLVSRILMVIVFAAYIFRSKALGCYASAFRAARTERKGARRIFSMGYPLALQTFMESSTFTMSTIMVGWIGAVALAAHQVTMTISQLFFMMLMGLSMATSVLISNSYGRQDYHAVRGYAGKGYMLSFLFSLLTCVVIYVFRHQVTGMFTDSPEVIAVSLSLLPVLFSYQFGDGLQLMFCNVLRGIQDVKPIMAMAFVSYYIIAMPAAYLLGFRTDLGITGIWLGFPIGLTTAGIFYLFRFRHRMRQLEADSLADMACTGNH